MSPRPHGQLRRSQVITTFGPGALLDLPDYSVIVGGLEHWEQRGPEILEERLLGKLREQLKEPRLQLFAPPTDTNEPGAERTGIKVWEFPEWFVAQREEKEGNIRSRPLVHARRLVRGKYQDDEDRRFDVQPIRWVQACERGHIDEIDWIGFVHEDANTTCRRELFLEEHGTTGDLSEISVRCACGKRQYLVRATARSEMRLGYCGGRRPWLGNNSRERCGGADGKPLPNRFLLRSASNAYFPISLSAISLPETDEEIRRAVDRVWEDFLQFTKSLERLEEERQRPKVKAALGELPTEAVWREVRRRHQGEAVQPKGIKSAEVETLLAQPEGLVDELPETTFFARRLPASSTPQVPGVDCVVLVHRLREVVAQVGFTRFESSQPDVEGELDLGVQLARLSSDATWLPAVENQGEGFFLSFRPQAIAEWLGRAKVKERMRVLEAGFDLWKQDTGRATARFPGLPYIFLHSLSHLLITTVSLVCGYASSSIRERIYASSSGYGILLYTGTPDAEGTLGGLVQVGRQLGRHLPEALELGRLCSNDPICAAHQPNVPATDRPLHGAVCHGCLLLPEPCCERRNELLDRALVVETVEGAGAAFFPGA